MRTATRRAAVAFCAVVVLLQAIEARQAARPASRFASEIERLSEAEGTFDTDNLISNETGYLRVIPALVSGGVSGGTYIGVGPDQNFSYIARIRPALAYIIDIRRDNLLLHLLFKALFARSTTRIEYATLLTGRAPPSDLDSWRRSTIAQIAAYVDAHRPAPPHIDAVRRQIRVAVARLGVPLSPADLDTIDRFHGTFISEGLDLQFRTFGRLPRSSYPTFRELLLATDSNGQTWNFLAREDDFQFVKSLQARDAVVPIVGNVAGTHSMRALAETIAARRGRVSAFYLSNVETYLNRNGDMARFAQNVDRLPHDGSSVMIRSMFERGGESTSVVGPFTAQPRSGR